jgi:hypothetical protein
MSEACALLYTVLALTMPIVIHRRTTRLLPTLTHPAAREGFVISYVGRTSTRTELNNVLCLERGGPVREWKGGLCFLSAA